MRGDRTKAVVAAAAMSLLLLAPIVTRPASAASGTAIEGLDDLVAMTATPTRVYLTGGPGTTSVAVMNVDGTQEASLTGVEGATGIAVHQDVLYVASHDASRIDRFDLSTDPPTALAPFDTSATGAPIQLVVAAGTIWFGTCAEVSPGLWDGVLGSLPLDDGDPITTSADDAWSQCPSLHWSAEAPGRLLLHSGGDTTDGIGAGWPAAPISSFDISGGALVPLTTEALSNPNNAPIVALPGGDTLAMGRPSEGVGTYATDLTPTGQYLGAGDEALTAVGGLLAGTGSGERTHVWVWEVGQPDPIWRYDFEPLSSVRPRGLLFADDGATLFAVVGDAGGPLELRILRPTKAPTDVVVARAPRTITFGKTTVVTVTLEEPGTARRVRLYADPVDGPVRVIGTKTADVVARWRLTPRVETSYRASWLGDDAWTELTSRWVTVRVRHEVTGTMLRWYAKRDGVPLYPADRRVFYTAQVRPPHPGERVALLLQQRVHGRWVFGGKGSFRQTKSGKVPVYIEAGALPEGLFRIHAVFRGDRRHLEGRSSWSLFRVT